MMTAFKKFISISTALSSLMLAAPGCGPQEFHKGSYEDAEKENLLNDRWSETDMQNTVKTLVESMVSHPVIRDAKRPPIVMVVKLQNKTQEVIETESITDMIQVELTRTGKVLFVNKQLRDDVKSEYDYQNSGMVSEETKKSAGGQVGADFLVDGRIENITQEVGKDKTVYYKVTLNLTNLKTNIITWTDHKQIRKVYRKKSVGF